MHLIIPAYNEAERLPATLASLRTYAAAHPTGEPLAVLVVDNASTDRTAEVAASFDGPDLSVSVLRCETPGKGAAVRAGVLSVTAGHRAGVVGFMDADGATDLSALAEGLSLIADGADMAIGSRAVDGSRTMARHSRLRQVGATAYRRQTGRITPGIADTQCGFKLMRADLARRIFTPLRCSGFSFDVEVLGRAQRLGARIAEFPVLWVDVPGSTFRPARHGFAAFWELARIGHLLGTYRPAAQLESLRVELPLLTGAAES
jgi:dolichyl-phosphate beta-glucosyltransferase